MRKAPALFLALAVLALAVFYAGQSAKDEPGQCKYTLVDSTALFDVVIDDKDKFKSFAGSFLPCEGGKFVVGEPFSRKGPYEVSEVLIEINDERNSGAKYSKSKKGTPLVTWEYEIGEGRAVIRLQFAKDALGQDFGRRLVSELAFRLDDLRNFDDQKARLERDRERVEKMEFSLLESGIAYEKNI